MTKWDIAQMFGLEYNYITVDENEYAFITGNDVEYFICGTDCSLEEAKEQVAGIFLEEIGNLVKDD